MIRKINLVLFFTLSITLLNAHAEDEDTIPTVKFGIQTFVERCTLCHGGQAMGEGKLALKIPGYPNTNLIKNLKAKDLESIRDVVIYGGILDNVSHYMPPFGNELTWTQIESVSMFIEGARKDPDTHLAMLKSINEETSKGKNLGREIFESRCVLCHGVNGEGDGRMAKIVKNPPPFNLTKSVMTKDYLKLIIKNGGEPLGRSGQMPPWVDQLNEQEIDAVIEYIIGLR